MELVVERASAGGAWALLALALTVSCSSKTSKEFATGGAAGGGGFAGSAQPGGAAGSAGNGGSSADGGASSGGSGGSASSAGESGSGGIGGDEGIGGFGGASDFPSTDILDDFNRADGNPGLNWIGSDSFTIVDEKLSCIDCASPGLWSTPFGPNQEVFATLSAFDVLASEINLVLKAQTDPDCNLIEVLYSPSEEQLLITYCQAGSYTDLDSTPITLAPGDRLGARAHQDNTVEIFVNEMRVAVVDVSVFEYGDGRIGVNGIEGDEPNRYDDFGGGNFQP